jgi:hypothetical protein
LLDFFDSDSILIKIYLGNGIAKTHSQSSRFLLLDADRTKDSGCLSDASSGVLGNGYRQSHLSQVGSLISCFLFLDADGTKDFRCLSDASSGYIRERHRSAK